MSPSTLQRGRLWRFPVWCGIALTFVRRSRRSTALLAALGGATIAGAAVLAVGAISCLGEAAQRFDARQFGQESETGCIVGLVRGDPLGYAQYDRVALALSPEERCSPTPPPPGFDEWPGSGEIFVSPEINRLRRASSSMAQRFPDVDGVLQKPGLTADNELRVVVFTDWSTVTEYPFRQTFQEFGARSRWQEQYLRMSPSSMRSYLVLFLVPTSVALGFSIASLDIKTRRRQLHLMGLIGFPTVVGRLQSVAISCLFGAAGGVVGVSIALWASRSITPTFAGVRGFAGDYSVQPGTGALLLLGVVVLVAVGSFVATVIRSTGRRSRLSATRVRLGVVASGLAILLCLSVVESTRENSALITLGRMLTFAGLGLSLAPVVSRVGHALFARQSSSAVLAGARLRTPAISTIVAGAALAGCLYVASLADGIANAASSEPAVVAQQFSTDGQSVLIVRRPSPEALAEVDGVPVILGFDSDGTNPGTIWGSCAAVYSAAGMRGSCTWPEFIAYSGTEPDLDLLPGVATNTPRERLLGPRAYVLGDVVVHTGSEGQPAVQADTAFVVVPASDAQALVDRVIATDPLANVRLGGGEIVAGTTELNGIVGAFSWGGNYAAVAAMLGLLISIVALGSDRKSHAKFSYVAGVPLHVLRRVLVAEVMIPSALACAMAIPLAWCWARLFALDRQVPALSIARVAWPYVRSLAIAACAAALLALSTVRVRGLLAAVDTDELPTVDEN